MRQLIRGVILLAVGLVAWNASLLRAEPIHDAARKGDVAEVRRLLEQDPRLANLIETGMNYGVTPLHYAAMEGRQAVVELLLSSRASLDSRGSYGTALELAVFYGHHDVAKLLLDKGARLDIFTASGLGKTDEVERLLRADKTLIVAADPAGQTALHWASFTGQKAVVELLLSKGAKVDQKTSKWEAFSAMATPLHYAAWAGRKDIAELLLAYGANVNARDDHKQTPLHAAVRSNHLTVAEALIAHGADVNARGNQFGTCPINAFSPNGQPPLPSLTTPLHLAAEHNSSDFVKLLLASKAEANARDCNGNTPLHLTNNGAVADLLRAAGAKE